MVAKDKKQKDAKLQVEVMKEDKKLRGKFESLVKIMKPYCVGQDDMITAMVLAVVSNHHLMMIGPYGCNKTGSLDIFTHLLGANDRTKMMREMVDPNVKYTQEQLSDASYTFYTTLDKYAQPEALIGPISLKAMREDDKWVRNLEGTIADADFAYIGEVFSASGATLRSLVRVINEREIENGGIRYPLRLRTVFGDSNLEPLDNMEAIYDRFLLRYPVNYIPATKEKAFTGMLLGSPFDFESTPAIMSLADLQLAHLSSQNIKLNSECASILFNLRNQLITDDNLILSDRRWNQSISVLKAAAWLRGSDTIEPCDVYQAMRFILFNRMEDFSKIEKILQPYKSRQRSANEEELMESLQKIYDEVKDSKDDQDLISATTQLSAYMPKFKSTELRRKALDMLEDLDEKLANIVSGMDNDEKPF